METALEICLEPLSAALGQGKAAILAATLAVALQSAPAETLSKLTQPELREVLEELRLPTPPATHMHPTCREHLRDILIATALRATAFDRIDNETIDGVIRALHIALLNQRAKSVADTLARLWSEGIDIPALTPLPGIARFMVEATRSAANLPILCPEATSEGIAIACMQMGRVPICVTATPPCMAVAYSLLTNSRLKLTIRPQGLEPSPENAPDGSPSPQVIVPRFGRPAFDIERIIQPAAELELPPEESYALHKAALQPAGTTIVLVSTRTLFSRGASAHRFRRFLVESGRLRAIVSFPASPLTGSFIPFSIMIFDGDKKAAAEPENKIVFCRVDEELHFTFPPGQLRTREGTFSGGPAILEALQKPNSVPWCRSIPLKDIATEDYILAVGRYLDPGTQSALKRAARDRRTVALGDITEVIKAQTLHSSSDPEAKEVGEISPGEFPPVGYLKRAPRERAVKPDDYRKHAKQVIGNGDVLLSTKGTIGKTAISLPNPNQAPIVASPSTVILRLKPNSPIGDPVVLLMYLRSPLFQSLLAAVVVGTTIPNVSLFDLRKLPVVVPTDEEQRRARRAFDEQIQLQQQVDDLQRQQANAVQDVWASLGLAETERRT